MPPKPQHHHFCNLDFQNDISCGQSLAMNSSFDVFSAVKNTSGISRAGNKCLSHYTRKEYFCPKVALLLSLSARFSLSTDFFEKNSVHVHINVVDNVGIGFFVGLSPSNVGKSRRFKRTHACNRVNVSRNLALRTK